jgi:AcrR family transcriptional regulator
MAVDPATEKRAAIFPRLPPGRGAMTPEEVARHQRGRLQAAMVEAVKLHGYADTTLRELLGLAGVSKAAFYQHFSDKQECFLATFDEIMEEVGSRVGEAYRHPGDLREKLATALSVFMVTAAEEPAAGSLVAVESLTLGRAGVEHRERASAAFEAMIAASFDPSPSIPPVSPLTIRAIVAGIRGIAYRRLRTGRQAELPDLVDELVDWTLGYQQPLGEEVLEAMAAAERPLPSLDVEPEDDLLPGWEEPPDSKLSRRRLSQRERMVRAAARVVVERGYESLSIPAISAAAGVSNQTFYEHFGSKRDAFIAAFEELAGETSAEITKVMDRVESGPARKGTAVRALLEHVAANELFAQLAFFELPTAGPPAMDRADQVLDSFTAMLESKGSSPRAGAEEPTAIREAVGSGIWAVIQHEIAHGRRAELGQIAPAIVALALVPLGTGA